MEDSFEKKLVTKMTLHLLPFLSVMYLFAFLDRANIGNAHTTFIRDINLSETDYSLGVSIFFVGYIIFEVPSNIMLKKVSCPSWFARIMVSWGIISLCMMFVSDLAGLLVVRLLLGIAEAGFFPGVVYYLSFWFTPNERAFRIGLFIASVPVSGMVSGLVAYGILQMDGILQLKGWQWLFMLEGIPSILIGILTYFVLPQSPSTVSWLTQEEKEKAINRLLNQGQESHHAKFSWSQMKGVFKDPQIWLSSLLYFTITVPTYSISFFLPAIIEKFGFSAIFSNLLSVPVHGLAVVAVVWNGIHSDRTKERFLHIVIPCLVGLVSWGLEGYGLITGNLPLQYIMIAISTATSNMCIPVALAWSMDCIKGSTGVAIASALVIGLGNAGGIVGPQIFGTSISLSGGYAWATVGMSSSSFLGIVVSVGLWLIMEYGNRNLLLEKESTPLLSDKRFSLSSNVNV